MLSNSFHTSHKFEWRFPLHLKLLSIAEMLTIFRTITFSNFLSHRTLFFKKSIFFFVPQYIKKF